MIPVKADNRYVPISPEEIIEQVHEAYELGITMVHVHARELDESPTYKSEVYEKIFSGIRAHCSELIICASLSGRDFPELEKRSEVLRLEPDMGSLTLSSLNFSRQVSVNSPQTILGLIDCMDTHGVRPELECFDLGMINYAKYLILKNKLRPPFYFNLLFGNIAGSQIDLLHMGLMVNELPQDSYWALAGLGPSQLVANTTAIAFGGGIRVGLEDNIWYDSKRKVRARNIDLLDRIHRIAGEFERPIMKPKQLGKKGFYNRNRANGA